MIGTIEGAAIEAIAGTVSKRRYAVQERVKGLMSEKKAARLAKSTGFAMLSVAGPHLCTSDMCLAAAEEIFAETPIRKSDIGALLFVSQSPDYVLPATSHVLQHRLGLSTDIAAMDIGLGCSGFVYGLYTAACMLPSLNKKKVLLCAGDIARPNSNPDDVSTRPIFGDAGTAAVIGESDKRMLFHINTYGERYDAIIVPRGACRKPKANEQDGLRIKENYTNMDGVAVMDFTLKDVPENVEALLAAYQIKKESVDLFVFHQANRLILTSLAESLDVPASKVPFAADEIGNTSSASIPLVFTQWRGRFEKDSLHRVLLSGFGVGLSIASVITDLSKTIFLKTVEI